MKGEEHREFVKDLSELLVHNMRKLGIEFPADVDVRMSERSIEFAFMENGKILFASDVTFYPSDDFNRTDSQINYGSSGAYTPHTEKGKPSVYRALFTTSLIKNWNSVRLEMEYACRCYKQKVLPPKL